VVRAAPPGTCANEASRIECDRVASSSGDARSDGLALAQQTAADRVGAGRDHDLRIWHAVVGGAQRAAHAARPGPGDQQHVGVPRAGGEEHAQPTDVVDRAEQRLDLPLLAAVGSGVHVPDVHAAAQRGGLPG
jgi:hypothetical protein